jgi:hypothetical protein
VLAVSAVLPRSAPGAALVPAGPGLGPHPIFVTAPADDARLFVVDNDGGVDVVHDGAVAATPFLTVPHVWGEGERGTLSLAFPPDYASSGRFYVFTVSDGLDTFGGAAQVGDALVLEYRRSGDPDVADPSSARLILRVHNPAGYHPGGQLLFGPDGLLYVTMGDGFSTPQYGQDPTRLLGKVLRLDPREQDDGAAYGIPNDNPYAADVRCGPDGGAAPCPEIFASGLRNPFRASFDRLNGDLFVSDDGQDSWEEVDRGLHIGSVPGDNALRGANLGWPTCEGAFLQGAAMPCPIDQTAPLYAYDHSAGGCTAIIGGVVVRDPTLPALGGRYLFGDYCAGDLRTIDPSTPGGDPHPLGLTVAPNTLWSFGEDSRGCVYVLGDTTVYRLAASAGDAFACPNPVTPRFAGIPVPPRPGETSAAAGAAGGAGGAPGPVPVAGGAAPGAATVDRTAPILRVRRHAQHLGRGRAVRVTVATDEDATIFASGSVSVRPVAGAAGRLRGAHAVAAAGHRTTLRLALPTALARRAGRALGAGSRVRADLTLVARDAAGNATRRSLRVRLLA